MHEGFYIKAKDIVWPGLSYMFPLRSRAVEEEGCPAEELSMPRMIQREVGKRVEYRDIHTNPLPSQEGTTRKDAKRFTFTLKTLLP